MTAHPLKVLRGIRRAGRAGGPAVQVYCCDPRSTGLKPLTQADLDAVAAEFNGRPRESLG